jgi:hypothetical protein
MMVPHRSKISDGTIGNAEHASRFSDHNPWVRDGNMGIVTAMDITHDPQHGMDAYHLAEVLRLGHDRRIKYIISNWKIANFKSTSAAPAWAWRGYHGINGHQHHTHISVRPDKFYYDDISAWNIGQVKVDPAIKPAVYIPMTEEAIAMAKKWPGH